jgi:hypothetical protein
MYLNVLKLNLSRTAKHTWIEHKRNGDILKEIKDKTPYVTTF